MLERNKKNDELIYQHTHDDFKGPSDGYWIMYPAPHSCLGPVSGLPDDLYADKLRYAVWKQACKEVDSALKPLMVKHGILDHYLSTEQWRENEQDVLTFVGFVLKGEAFKKFEVNLISLDINFPTKLG